MSLHLNVNFRPKAPWFGGDLQTMSAVLSPPKVSLDGATIEELRIDTDDGTGDILLGQRLEQAPSRETTVVLLHGLLGDYDRDYMRLLTRHYLDNGYPVVRMNLRGAGASRLLCSRNYHGGFTQDLTVMARSLAARRDTGRLAWIGISLSGNMLLKAASETAFCGAADLPRVVPAHCRRVDGELRADLEKFFGQKVVVMVVGGVDERRLPQSEVKRAVTESLEAQPHVLHLQRGRQQC